MNSDTCDFCDYLGGEKTCENQVCRPIGRRVRAIDYCIHSIVAALNAGGILTVASCYGHKKMLGRIDLDDGRVLVILDGPFSIANDQDHTAWKSVVKLYDIQ